MTHNQIEYWKLKETARSNKAQERETNRSNLAREFETERSNRANEALKAEGNVINQLHFERADAETARSNRARENEQARSNLAQEALKAESNQNERARVILGYDTNRTNTGIAQINAAVGYAQLAEQNRANLAREAETNRINTLNAAARFKELRIDSKNAETNKKNAQTRAGELSLKQREYNEVGQKQGFANVAKTLSSLKSDNYSRAATFSGIINNTVGSYNSTVRNVKDVVPFAVKALVPK